VTLLHCVKLLTVKFSRQRQRCLKLATLAVKVTSQAARISFLRKNFVWETFVSTIGKQYILRNNEDYI